MTISARPADPYRAPHVMPHFSMRLLMSGASALALLTAACGTASAQGGNGPGINYSAVGGADSATGAGADGANNDSGSNGGAGAGGGAGVTGGAGGYGNRNGTHWSGGAGGATPGADGADGESSTGSGTAGAAGGGGGGAHGYVGVALPDNAVSGGHGGAGGAGDYFGGGGGAGGWGAVVTGTGSGTLTVDVTGGAGGAGGAAVGTGGDGGTGGPGLYFTDPSGFSLTVQSAVSGGDGGAGGEAYFTPGAAGAGGAGIVGQNLQIILASGGSITGGLSGDGVTRAAAVEYTGGVNSFELQAGAAVTGNVLAYSTADTFRLGGAEDMSFDVSRLDGDGTDEGEQFIGFGTFQKVGTGIATLTGTNTEVAEFDVLGGSVYVNGTMASTYFAVADGTRLGGSGTIGVLAADAGSVISPGAEGAVGTLTVTGSVTFAAGSVYEVDANATDSADMIVVATATLNGGVIQEPTGGAQYVPGSTYTILSTTGGVNGEFDGVEIDRAFLSFALVTDYYDVNLVVSRNGLSFASAGVTSNQRATGAGTESLGTGNSIYDAVLNLPSVGAAQRAFDQLSGEIHASIQTSLVEDSRFLRNAAWERLRAPQDDAPGMWVQGFGSWGDFGGDANAAELSRNIGGVFLGADGVLFDSWRVGALAGYSQSDFDVNDRSSSGSSDNYSLGLYAGKSWGATSLRSGLAYTWHEIDTDRSVVFPGFADQLSSSSSAGTFQLFGELGYGFTWNGTTLEPFVNLAYVNLNADNFTEAGGAAALTGSSETMNTGFSTLGLRASSSFTLGTMTATAKGLVGWSAAFGDTDSSVTMAYASDSAPFVVSGVPLATNALVVNAGLDLAVSPIAVAGISYGGMFGSGLTDQTFMANLNVKF